MAKNSKRTRSPKAPKETAVTTPAENTTTTPAEESATETSTNSVESDAPATSKENTTVQTLSFIKANKNGTAFYRLAGNSGSVRIAKTLFGKADDGSILYPQTIQVGAEGFAAADEAKAAKLAEKAAKRGQRTQNAEERAKVLQARAEKAQARAAKAAERAAKAAAKLAPKAEEAPATA